MNIIYDRIYCLDPVINSDSRVLILGTMPGADSLSSKMYYANPTNHFWDFMHRILVADYPPYKLFDTNTPKEERYQLLLTNGIALWDTLSDCIRKGSSDKKITDLHYNNISALVAKYNFEHIICSSKKAMKYLKDSGQYKLLRSQTVSMLNSTSSQNTQNTFAVFHQWRAKFSELGFSNKHSEV